jgi:hypothetical protein
VIAALLIQLAVLGADASGVTITWDPDILADVKRGGYDAVATKMINNATTYVSYALTLPLEKPLQFKIYAPRAYERTFAPGRAARLFAHYSDHVIHIDGGSRIDAFFNAMLVHEVTLAVLDSAGNGGHFPTWMAEGLATVLEREAVGQTKIDLMQRILIKDALRKGELGALTALKQPLDSNGCLEAQAAVLLLMEHYTRPTVMQLFHDIAAGDDATKAWKKLGTDPQTFAREFAAWVANTPS